MVAVLIAMFAGGLVGYGLGSIAIFAFRKFTEKRGRYDR